MFGIDNLFFPVDGREYAFQKYATLRGSFGINQQLNPAQLNAHAIVARQDLG